MSYEPATPTATRRFGSVWTLESVLWGLAIVLFGVGDLVTTVYFIETAGAVETHPLGAAAIDGFGYWALVPLKALAFAVLYGLYRLVPRPHAIGVPIGLVLFGAALTVWNTAISVTGSPPA